MGLGKTEGMQKAFKAGAAVGANRIVKFDADDDHVIQATGARDGMIGVAQHAAQAAEDGVRVMFTGITDVVYGGPVTRGDLLTADADGKAVPMTASGIHQAAVDGAAVNTDISVEGITTGDELVSVIELATDYADRTGVASISSDGKIRLTQATAGDRLLVTWRRNNRIVGIAGKSGVSGDLAPMLLCPQGV